MQVFIYQLWYPVSFSCLILRIIPLRNKEKQVSSIILMVPVKNLWHATLNSDKQEDL